jgi:hypothetical protein
VTLKTALKYVLRNSGLTYLVEDGIITITAGAPPGTDRVNVSKVRRVYPVADLVGQAENAEDLIRVIRNTVDSPRSWAPRRIAVAPAGAGGLGVGPMQLGIGGAGGIGVLPADDPFDNPEGGTIEYFAEGKSLVINQTREIQDQIGELLDELRISKKQQEKR